MSKFRENLPCIGKAIFIILCQTWAFVISLLLAYAIANTISPNSTKKVELKNYCNGGDPIESVYKCFKQPHGEITNE